MKQIMAIVVTVLTGWCSSALSGGVPGVGSTNTFPDAEQSGAPVEVQLWQWGEGDQRKIVTLVTNGAAIPYQLFKTNVMSVRFRVPVNHDTISAYLWSSDQTPQMGWGPDLVVPYEGDITARVYRICPEIYANFPAAGRYCIAVEASEHGESVASLTAHFSIVDGRPIPVNTTVLKGRKDCYGNPIVGSRQVVLGKLNETARMKDNDYPFEPQRAYHTINFERFPPFEMPERFFQVWCSRRFSEEPQMGGPLNRGFNAVANVDPAIDNLPVDRRCWWHTPDLQVMLINQWYATNPVANADLKLYAEHRTAFVSPSNAYKLGWECFGSWGAAGWGPYVAGVYGWDEEQMWPTIGAKMVKDYPQSVPAHLTKYLETDPELKNGDNLYRIEREYEKWWGDFVGYTYRGARDRAAQTGHKIKIWHYGSKSPGNQLFTWGGHENGPDGKPKYENMDENLFPWFKKNGKIDFGATEYARQIDYFHKDFYYHTVFPQKSTMYEKDAKGAYVPDENGRRKIRKDVFEEQLYAYPVKIGHEDCEVSPMFLKRFIAMGEDALYWLNGGRYSKTNGATITAKQLIPALRPGNQETWGESGKLGQRPVSPFMAEAAVIFTYMNGLEGIFLWDAANNTGPIGGEPDGKTEPEEKVRPYIEKGDMEYIIKGLHRVSQFKKLFEGRYAYVRPTRVFDTWNRDNATLIRGIMNGRYMVLAMCNPYLDPGETQDVEIWYGTSFANRKRAAWHDTVTIEARKNHLFQCKLPTPPGGGTYDPDKLYFRWTLKDGTYSKEFTVTGNYHANYPYGEKQTTKE